MYIPEFATPGKICADGEGIRSLGFEPNMTPEIEKEIRAILALQKEIEDKKAEVSKRLAVIRHREGEDTNMIVIDGELWKITRWGELRGPIRAESFSAWCLESRGKVP